jgi:SIR2-like domain
MALMPLDEFLRLFPIRASSLAWFLGAGASASARLPTAGDLIWRFKRTLYCTSAKVDPRTCDDLGNEVVRARLQRYLDSMGKYPALDAPEEYASYFEQTYPAPEDRRRFIEAMLQGSTPSFGHHILAALMKAGKARMIWTTNFDRLVEDAAATAFGSTSALTVSTIDSSAVAIRALNDGSWPLLGKLHGDFQSVALKNTTDELRTQESALRSALIESCKRFGLIVAGYSGRDESVMNTLEEAVAQPNAYPGGLFWVMRSGSPVYSRVEALLARARSAGIQGALIETETFDELMGDLAQQVEDLPSDLLDKLNKMRSKVSNVSLPAPGTGWPLVRMNAVPILNWPKECRKFDARIGGAKEVRELLRGKTAKLVAVRSQHGVLAFGADAEIRRVFAGHQPDKLDLHSIEAARLWRETNELNLLRNALVHGLIQNMPLIAWAGRGNHDLHVDPASANAPQLAPLRTTLKVITGTIPETDVKWSEGVSIRIEYRLGRLWMLLEPTVQFEKTKNDDERYLCGDFVRERQARRYNRVADGIFNAWLQVLLPGTQDAEIRAFDGAPGIEARFVISRRTAFTRRSS